MNIPLLQTKLQLPAIPSASLYSDRIKKLALREYRLAILVAPAGFGKTTSVLLSLQKNRQSIKWYRLEKEDSFLSVFYQHLLSMIFGDRDMSTIDSFHLFKSLQNIQEQYPLLNAQICEDMSYFWGDCKHTMFFVFDDYHNVVENEVITKTIQYFVHNMPKCIHFIITSRVDPQILTGKLVLEIKSRQFESSDLLFTRAEIEELVHRIYKMEITKEQLDFVFRESEGWIAGVNIICHNTDFSKGNSSIMGDQKSFIFNTFLNEYLLSIDLSKRQMLMKLSVLDDFSLDEIQFLFQEKNALESINWLESSNLYLQKIQGDSTRYRFHALFQSKLQDLFEKEYSNHDKMEIYIRIAKFYQPNDFIRSLSFYLRAGNEQKAISIANEKIKKLFHEGTPESCFPILNLFTKEQIASNPYFLFMDAMRIINTRSEEAQKSILNSMDMFRQIKDYNFFMNAFGMIMVISFQANNFNLLNQVSAKIPRFQILFRGGDARIQLIISLFISLTGEDRLKRAKKYRRYLDGQSITNEMWDFSYLMIRGIYYYRKGEFKEARLNLERILSHPVIHSNDQWRIIALVSCCNVSFLTADQDLIKFFIQEFALLGERYNSEFSLGYAHYMSGFQKFQQRNEVKSIESFKNARKYYEIYGSKVLAEESSLYVLLIEEKNPDANAIAKAQEYLSFFKKENPGHGIYELSQCVLGVLYKRRGEYEKALEYLHSSLSLSQAKGTMHDVYGIHLQLADCYLLCCDVDKFKFHASKWMELGEKRDYRYAKEMDFETLFRVIQHLRDSGLDSPYLNLMESIYSIDKEKAVEEDIIYIKLFGTFELKFRDLILSERDFKTKKVSGVFKYILAGDLPQSREHLASIFWANSDRKSAYTSLRVAIYELRKALADTLLSFNGDIPLLEEDERGFFKNPHYRVKNDVEEFECLYQRWKVGEYGNETQALLKIAELYTGVFLENADYDDWAMIKREHYHAMYFEVIHSLGKLAIREQSFHPTKYLERALELDPLDEMSCAILIHLYHQSGEIDRANVIEKQFRKRFKKDMGMEPMLDLEMKSL